MFGLFKKKPTAPAPTSTATQDVVIDVAPGEDFSDLTTVELCDAALATGRLEPFLLIGDQFGGEPAGPNLILGPAGSAAAKARIDDEIADAIRAGQEVGLEAGLEYADGGARVPKAVRFDLGALGVRTLRLW